MSISKWPSNWNDLTQGIGCEMCDAGRPDSDKYGVLIRRGRNTDSYLQRAAIQRGYTLVIWRGWHVTEPIELSEADAAAYWLDVLATARGLVTYYRPIKMNYETLGNSLPHLHTHLVPRYADNDPAPGRPFPLLPQDGAEAKFPDAQFQADAKAIRALLNSS